ncbi:hypothetical protein GCM10011344_03390 [Dokdonia pacifica]|uniref:Outer membrane protein beta-barrel domain-containing protein n=1 Tax=Dokdonia pacifica TaxID=1627892 RepID=A0A238ZGX3_9FLAO|nr:hypothetical protein [Dokdonia pacifica]GGG06239.1 hypothetical protein GCM10011344_03390 [Dokdonia pacifica]SNR82258.1 hypothetical protein SAMN06265376_103200 [Dokdonia pacifica]
MKRKYIFLFIAFIYCFSIQAQTKNRKGYYIDNNGSKKEGFIKDLDWGITPESFTFYSSENTEGKTITIAQASGFGIYNVSKYERHKVNIDRSSNKLNDLGRDRDPNMKVETLFLKVELEGALKLYSHSITAGTKFFVQKKGELIYPLVYKRFLTYDNKINENNYFRQQLTSDFACEELSYNTSNLSYKRSDIIKYVEKYNSCKGEVTTRIGEKEKGATFNIYLLAGANYNSFRIKESNNSNFDFGSEVNPTFGFEIEFLLPNNNNKWAAFIDGRYTTFNKGGSSSFESLLTDVIFTQDVEADLSFFDISLGGRHYFFLNPSTKIHLGISYGVEVIANTDVTYTISQDITATNGQGSLGLSAGFSWKNFRGDIRYNTLKEHIPSKSEYTSLMVTLSYNILKF